MVFSYALNAIDTREIWNAKTIVNTYINLAMLELYLEIL